MIENDVVSLDLTDRKILQELDKNCRIASTVLAKKVKKSRQAVEYRIHQLVEKGVITGFHTAFNPHKMGYKIYKVYLKLRNIPEQKKALLAFLKSCGTVYWMGECSGSWDLIFGIFAKSDYSFYDTKNEIISRFSGIIVAEEGQVLLDVRQFPKMHLTHQISEPVLFGGDVVANELDALEYRILSVIVNNGRIPIVELARSVNSTASIVMGVLKRLEKTGVIIQYRIGVNLNKLGLELYKAIIKVDKFDSRDANTMLHYFSQLTQTQYYIQNLWSIEPEIVVANYQEYYQLIEKVKQEFPNVIRTVDSVLMITDEWTPGYGALLSSRK